MFPIPLGPRVNSGALVTPHPVYIRYIHILFMLAIVGQLVLAALRFYLLDVFAGVVMILVSIFGVYIAALSYDIHWVATYGIMIMFYAVVHTAMFIERLVQAPQPLLTGEFKYIVYDVVLLLTPIFDMVLGLLCYITFRTRVWNNEVMQPYEQRYGATGDAGRSPRPGAVSGSGAVGSAATGSGLSGMFGAGGSQGFTPFSGSSYKLGGK